MAHAEFAGHYVALEKGFYRDAGLDVEIVHPSMSESAMDRISSQKCQVTVLTLTQALDLIDKGLPLVNILQTSMNNPLCLISRHGEDPLTLKGKRVGYWSAGSGLLALCMNNKEHLGYQWVNFISNINLFVAGAIDATVAMSHNEYYQLLQAGMELTEKSVYRFCEHDYNIQGDGVYMTKSYYEKHREEAKRFAAATLKGWEWVVTHKEETIDIVMKYVRQNRVGTNRTLQELMLDEILRLQIDRESKKREFRLRPDMVKHACELMMASGIMKHEVRYEEIIAR
jgi:NitT/TauT family transport system substrate-binding protein